MQSLAFPTTTKIHLISAIHFLNSLKTLRFTKIVQRVPWLRLVYEPLYLAHYIERAGTGTLDMIRLCAKAGLPEPEFRSEGERFITVIRRDWLTDEVMNELELNTRQCQAVQYVKTHHRIGNSEYQALAGIAKRTAHRDLADLVAKGVFVKIGTRGKGTVYGFKRQKGH